MEAEYENVIVSVCAYSNEYRGGYGDSGREEVEL